MQRYNVQPLFRKISSASSCVHGTWMVGSVELMKDLLFLNLTDLGFLGLFGS